MPLLWFILKSIPHTPHNLQKLFRKIIKFGTIRITLLNPSNPPPIINPGNGNNFLNPFFKLET